MKNLLSIATLVWLLVPAIASCQSAPVTVKPGQYRAVLKTRGGDLPFGLDIQSAGKDTKTYTVFALNGNERLPMDPATVQGDSIGFQCPYLNPN
ncbi:hypothetical protein [Spirosoma sp. KNUC1025]|uniref:hypothetical protein n=1 Tax=Spirosoma sp. KNUC1025 TaxID=2894082 RepID=UPI003865AF21